MKKGILSSLLALTLLSTLFAATSFAAPPTGTVYITGGTLTLLSPTITTDFGTVVLNGSTQTVPATLGPWGVIDATGTGNGWRVTAQATQFREVTPGGGFASGTSARTLPIGSMRLAGTRSVTAATGSTPVDALNGPLVLNATAALDGIATPVIILQTQTSYGMGTYNVIEPANGLLLTLEPQSTYVDLTNYPTSPTPYSSTLTLSLISGP